MFVGVRRRVRFFLVLWLLLAFRTLQQMLHIPRAVRLLCFLISQSIKLSIKWYLTERKTPLTKQHDGRHNLWLQQDLMTSGEFVTTGNF